MPIMNIFVLDRCVRALAKAYFATHLTKIPLEIAQILTAALHLRGMLPKTLPHPYCDEEADIKPYRVSHTHHPWCIATARSPAVYRYVVSVGTALFDQFEAVRGKNHKSRLWFDALAKLVPDTEVELPYRGETVDALFVPADGPECRVPLCFPVDYIRRDSSGKVDVVASYRQYVIQDKARLAKWDCAQSPTWWPCSARVAAKRLQEPPHAKRKRFKAAVKETI